jgi:hypothetical protein
VIFNMIGDGMAGVVIGLLGFLPSGAGVGALDLGGAFGVMKTFDAWLPIHETLTGVAVCIALLGAVFGFALFRQALRFVPFVNMG